MSFVEVKNLEPTTFEECYYDEYEYYNLTDRYSGKVFCLNSASIILTMTDIGYNFFAISYGPSLEFERLQISNNVFGLNGVLRLYSFEVAYVEKITKALSATFKGLLRIFPARYLCQWPNCGYSVG